MNYSRPENNLILRHVAELMIELAKSERQRRRNGEDESYGLIARETIGYGDMDGFYEEQEKIRARRQVEDFNLENLERLLHPEINRERGEQPAPKMNENQSSRATHSGVLALAEQMAAKMGT